MSALRRVAALRNETLHPLGAAHARQRTSAGIEGAGGGSPLPSAACGVVKKCCQKHQPAAPPSVPPSWIIPVGSASAPARQASATVSQGVGALAHPRAGRQLPPPGGQERMSARVHAGPPSDRKRTVSAPRRRAKRETTRRSPRRTLAPILGLPPPFVR